MKKDMQLTFILFILVFFIGGVILPQININKSCMGTIIDKYRNGQGKTVFHIVLKENEDDKRLDIVITKKEYDNLEIDDKIRVEYNLFKKAIRVVPIGR